jgi:hypothetical protein
VLDCGRFVARGNVPVPASPVSLESVGGSLVYDAGGVSLALARTRTARALRGRAAALVLIVLVGVGAAAEVANVRARTVAQQAVGVGASANALLVDLLNAETSERGFLITANERYLQPYGAATRAVPLDLRTLSARTARWPQCCR